MNHISTPTITHATDEDLSHLETCERCRSRLTTDVDLGSVRARILSEATTEPRSVEPRKRALARPWLIGVTAATAVLVLFLPLLFTGGESPADSPVVSSPEPPAIGADTSSFEMTFEAANGVAGKLVWAGPSRYEGFRAISADNGAATFQYGFFQTEDEAGSYTDALDPFPRDEEGRTVPNTPEDPSIPWSILLNRESPAEMWAEIDAAGEPVTDETTHPLATGAYTDGESRLEWNGENVPVLVETPTIDFGATDLTRRAIRAEEIGISLRLPFLYALYLAETTSPEQEPVLDSGLVTFSDYQSAAGATAQCAGVEASFDTESGLFVFADSPDLEDCQRRHLDDIEEVWRVDSRQLSEDEHTLLWATITDRPEEAEIYEAEPGPRHTLASGEGWSITVWQQGPAVCFSLSNNIGGTGGQGCLRPEDFSIPHVLNANFAMSYEDDQLLGGEVLGQVTEDADRLVLSFESGESIEIQPQETVYFGYRGFGLPDFDGELGEPTTLEVFDGTTSLGVYHHTPVSELND